MDHDHGPQSSISDEADARYRPLEGLGAWGAVEVDEEAWVGALATLQGLRLADPDWSAMVGRGAMVAAAYQSGALDGAHDGDPEVGLALLQGRAQMTGVGDAALAHVRANYEALLLARGAEVSQGTIRRLHEVACRPQRTHRVLVEGRAQDHVLAAGDYKHHPNHVLTDAGAWQASAPVSLVEAELAGVVDATAAPEFASLHPVGQAAYLHHALLHVKPFADGNGRVARALAGGRLLRSGGPPLLLLLGDATAHADPDSPAAMVAVVQRAVLGLARALACCEHDGAAVDRWRRQEASANALRAQLAAGVPDALKRHTGATGRRADLSAATVVGEEPLVIREPLSGVDEMLTVDAHPLDDSPLSVTAREAGLRLEATGPIGPWLDRVVSILALRVAAEAE